MMQTATLIRNDLVLIGGGHAHVHVLKMLGMPKHRRWLSNNGVQVTLIARDLHTPYSGMLPGFIAGHYSYDDIHLDLQKLCRFSKIRLVHASATRITYNEGDDKPTGLVYCDDDRPPIRFDCLSIDIGITPSTSSISISDNAAFGSESALTVPVKPIANFCRYYQNLQETIIRQCDNNNNNNNQRLKQQSTNTVTSQKHTVAVVGGGAGGIELALSMDYSFRSQGYGSMVQVLVVTRGSSLLEQHNKAVQRIFARILQTRSIPVYLGTEVVGVEAAVGRRKKLVLAPPSGHHRKDPLIVDDVLWCTQASAASWLSENTPFSTTYQGNFVQVQATYESISHRGVFACGDCCHMVDYPRPKAGVFAVRAGPVILENVTRYLSDQPLKVYVPQRDFLGLISTGDKYAIASKGWWFALEGRFLWTIKDYIDRSWMEKYTIGPTAVEDMMPQLNLEPPRKKRRRGWWSDHLRQHQFNPKEDSAVDAMRCGGCGAKVGATTVSRALSAVHKRQVQRAVALKQPAPPPIDHDDAAILHLPQQQTIGGGGAVIQTIDYFRSLMDDPYVFGKIVAVHALSDIHAMGCSAQSALALAVVPFAANESVTESLLTHILSGISDILQAENVQLVGGHTCEGIELACGLSVTGYTDNPSQLLRKRGGRIGDKIVLTKPLGTGALFAADMRAQCRGEHVAEAIKSMAQSNISASQLAMKSCHRYGIHACTDCTGFGFVGHLLEMLLANETDSKWKGEQQSEPQGIGALLHIESMSFLQGGLEASRRQIFSSLHPKNRESRRAVINDHAAALAFPEEYPLLFDPQTAGGLIFFVDPEACDSFLSALRKDYPFASIVGELIPYPESGMALRGGVCPIGSGTYSGQRVRIAV